MTREEAIEVLMEVIRQMNCDEWKDVHLYAKVIEVIEYLKRDLGERLIEVLREVRGEI